VGNNFKSFRGRVRFNDVMMLLRNKFPNYLDDAFIVFKRYKRYPLLGMKIRFPVDNFYHHSSSEFVKVTFVQVVVGPVAVQKSS
jgi:hypothetical protein